MLNIVILLHLVKDIWCTCSYQTFDESQLNSSLFYGEQFYTRSDSYAFGIWTMYAPLRQNFYYNQQKGIFNSNLTEATDDGYHILNYQSDGKIHTLYKLGRLNNIDFSKPLNMTIIQETTTVNKQYTFNFKASSFEGYWIFMYFCFQYSKTKKGYNFVSYNPIDDSYQSTYVSNLQLVIPLTDVKVEYGGAGQYKIGSKSYNLNVFPGRISKPSSMDIIFYTSSQKISFLKIVNQCLMPFPCNTVQEIKVLDDVYSFNNLTNIDYQYDIPGQRYFVDFWIKRNSLFQMQKPEFILQYGSNFKNLAGIIQLMLYIYPFEKNMIFQVQTTIYNIYPLDTISGEIHSLVNTKFLISLQQLSEWNFIRFDFNRNKQTQYLTVFVYSSSNDLDFYQQELLGNDYQYEYTNFQAHLSVMSSRVVSDPKLFSHFQGHIANLKITYCNQQSPEFNLNSNLNCHSQCLTCKGPTKWDCLSCNADQNRQFLDSKNQCICLRGFEEVDNEAVCKQKTHFVPTLTSSKNYYVNICQYGYFEYWYDNLFIDCLPCPLNNNGLSDCLDCLLNSQNWYLNPICSYYYISNNGIYYTLQQRDTIDYFFIDSEYSSVYQCDGCQQKDICNQNRYKLNNNCIECTNNCKICNYDKCQQCEIGYYFIDNYCEQCNQTCQQCDIIDNQIQCTICYDKYALYQGQCYQCGLNCLKCEIRFTKMNFQYVKCLQCQFDTYPSLDGENCYYNPDQFYCISPFQYSSQNYSISTMLYNFEPQPYEFITSGCVHCIPYVALNITDHDMHCAVFFDIMYGCSFPYIFSGQNYCLIGQDGEYMDFDHPYNSTQFHGIGFCFHIIPQCLYCFDNMYYEQGQMCLICEQGYYNDYYTSLCKACPDECTACLETDVSNIYKMSDFILYNLLYSYSLLQFQLFTQDPDQNHIYIICTQCKEGYTFHEGKCILNCPYNCKECIIQNNKHICISCEQLNEYSSYTIQDGLCIECPINCKLCTLRTKEQKQLFNPYFNNQKYDIFSNLCVQSFDDWLFYDQEIKQFTDCNNCQKEVNIEINVLCNSDQTNTFNINIEQLFNSNLNNYLQNIETVDYYLYLNQEYVKQINYKFTLQQNSICYLNDNTYFTSTLQSNVFNLRYVNFIIDGNNSTLIINGQITLSNFTLIDIRNLNIKDGGIITNNIKDYSIFMENISVTSSRNLNTFQFNNVTNVVMDYISIFNMSYNNTSFLIINSAQSYVIINLQQWYINSVQFVETVIVQLNIQQLNLIFQNNFLFRCSIIQSQLLEYPLNNDISLNNLTIKENSIKNCYGLLQFANKVQINQFSIILSSILNSIIIKTQLGIEIRNSLFSNLHVFGNTTLLSANTFKSDCKIILLNINYIDIVYQEKQSLLSISNTGNYEISVYIQQVRLEQISLNSLYINSKIQESIDNSIIYLKCNLVILKDLSIKRGIGFREFTIIGSEQVEFSNSQITLDDLFQFKSLNVNTNCDNSINSLYRSFMILYNVRIMKFKFLTIFKIIIFDSIFIDSQQSIDLNSPIVEMSNCNFSSNIIHLLTSQQTASLLKISSLQDLPVNLYENTYKQNLLFIQEKINVDTQGLLFNIAASITNISESIFEQNMIVGGQSSIILIQSTQINIKNSNFQNNSIFQYSTLKQFIVWGFDMEIFQEDLEQLYPVVSYGGNGNLRANQINVINSNIQNSYSKQGAAFATEILENGNLYVFNSSFSNLKTDASGGCFYIQSNSINLFINLEESIFINISSNQYGSVLYLKTSTIITNVNFQNLNLIHIYALQGPLIYIYQQNQGNPYFKMTECLLSNDDTKFQDFVNGISQISSADIITLSQYFSLVYFTDGMIDISNLLIKEFPQVQLFYFQNQVLLRDITVLNQLFSRPLLIFNKNVNPIKIEITNFYIKNCTLLTDFQIIEQNIVKSLKTRSQSCNEYLIPEYIQSQGQTLSNQNQIKLLKYNQEQQINGVIIFQGFQKEDIITLKQIQIQINCRKCQFGVLSFLDIQSTDITINNIVIDNSLCGLYGCLHIASAQNRLLKETQKQERTSILITNLLCSNNNAEQGGCLFLQSQQIQIKDSKIINNTAIQGGAIYLQGEQSILDSTNLFIINNTAKEGSGIYCSDVYFYTQNGLTFIENTGKTLKQSPSVIQIELIPNQIIAPTIISKDQYSIVNKILTNNGSEAILYLPTGIEIYKYRIFDLKSNSYRNYSQILRLYVLTDTLDAQDLEGTFCNCTVIDEKGIKYVNLINKNTFYFNQSYNLDDLILYIPQDFNKQFWLQFWCSSIFNPVIQDGQIQSYHQNNTLLVKIRPYKCQLGEYHINEQDYCHQCQLELQQYSVSQNSTFCSIKNDQIMSEITPAQVKLNPGYWKYQLSSTTFDSCLNKKQNCIGGWDYGNQLCQKGFVGALCEQCDYYNVMGNGYYEHSDRYDCILCQNSSSTKVVLLVLCTIIIFLILMHIFNSLSSSVNDIDQSYKLKNKRFLNLKEAILGQYIQIAIQYFQIISLQIDLNQIYPFWLEAIIDIVGNPFQLMKIVNICKLIDSDISILYLDIFQNSLCLIVFIILFQALQYLIMLFMHKSIPFIKQINFTFFVYFYFSISFIRCLLRLISVRQIQDEYWVYQNIAYMFNEQNHVIFVFTVFLPLLIIFGVLIPVIIMFLLSMKDNSKIINEFGIWIIAFKNYQSQPLKLMIVIIYATSIIATDGTTALRAAFAFVVLLIYYTITNFKLVYMNHQQNKFEQSLLVSSMYILILSGFHRVIELQIFQSLIKIIITILFIINLVLIIKKILQTKSNTIMKIKKQVMRKIIPILPTFISKNIFFNKYFEETEAQHKRRIQQLKEYIITEGRIQVKLKKNQYKSIMTSSVQS